MLNSKRTNLALPKVQAFHAGVSVQIPCGCGRPVSEKQLSWNQSTI